MNNHMFSKLLLLSATLLLACDCLSDSAAQLNKQPAYIDIKDTSRTCSSKYIRQRLKREIEQELNNWLDPPPYGRGLDRLFPADSCADIYPANSSGYYWLNAGLQPKQVYCSINENPCCNDSDARWMRIAYLNMSHPTAQCPHPWRELDSPIRTCRRQFNTSISSVNYSSYGIPYSKVCGRIIAYQFGSPEAFLGYTQQNQTTIDKPYVDGISITYGEHPRNHIWTFAAARNNFYNCPCTGGITTAPPPFINKDYFCERGTISDYNLDFIDDNPLWDGHGCTGSSTCCEFNNPPWFCKQLPEPTTEDIEIRILTSAVNEYYLSTEGTPVEFIEMYVQ